MSKKYLKHPEYYSISTPIEKNKDTGNFTFQNWMIRYPYKDFLFDGIDPETGERVVKIIDRWYVKSHSWRRTEYKEVKHPDGTLTLEKVLSYYRLISYKSIKNYVEPKNVEAISKAILNEE